MTEQHNETPRADETAKTSDSTLTGEGEIIDLTCPEGDYSLWPAQGTQASTLKHQQEHGENTSLPDEFGDPSEPDGFDAQDSSFLPENDDAGEHDALPPDSTSGTEPDSELQTARPGSESGTDSGAESGLVPSPDTKQDTKQDTGPVETPGQAEERPMTLLDHLTELRNRLLRAFIAVAVGFLLCYSVAKTLFHYLALPLIHVLPGDSRLMFTGLPGGFFVELKVAFVAGIFLASPYLFYQIWAFIAPGLYASERKYVTPLAACSALFFLGGASFCYFVVFPFAFSFFMGYATDIIVAMPSINEYLSFSLEMLMAFGLIFEMPLFAFFLARMGLITAVKMRKARRYAVLGVFIVAAILTPPDVFSQMLMAVPMLLLYELSILVAVMVGKNRQAAKVSAEAS